MSNCYSAVTATGRLERSALSASLFLAFISLLPTKSSAQTSGAAFLNIIPSVRASGLGMAGGVTALGAEAIDSNPSNLGLMSHRFDIFTSYASLMNNTSYEHLSAAFAPASHFLSIDALGFSVTRLQTANIPGADSQGNLSGSSYGSGDTAIALSGSALVSSRLRLGLTAKAIQSQIAGYTSNIAPAGDLGISYSLSRLSQSAFIGASLINMGSGIKFVQQTDKLPTAASIGGALPLGPAMIAVEVNRLIYQQQNQFRMGIEYGIGPVSFRSGYTAQNQSGNLALQDQSATLGRMLASGLTAGIGVEIGSAKLDYAFGEQTAEYGMTQRVALSVQWGNRSSSLPKRAKNNLAPKADGADWYTRPLGEIR